jgi:hypothetical protein
MKCSFNGMLAVLVVLLMASVVIAQSVSTHIIFVVPTITGFRVTLPGTGGYNSSSASTNVTADIIFNESVVRNYTNGNLYVLSVNATRRYTPSDGQSSASGIFNYTNTGTVMINVSIQLDAALPIWPTSTNTIKLYAGNQSADFATQPCNAEGTGLYTGKCVYVNNTAKSAVGQNLSVGSATSVWLWADLINMSTGTSEVNVSHFQHN